MALSHLCSWSFQLLGEWDPPLLLSTNAYSHPPCTDERTELQHSDEMTHADVGSHSLL